MSEQVFSDEELSEMVIRLFDDAGSEGLTEAATYAALDELISMRVFGAMYQLWEDGRIRAQWDYAAERLTWAVADQERECDPEATR